MYLHCSRITQWKLTNSNDFFYDNRKIIVVQAGSGAQKDTFKEDRRIQLKGGKTPQYHRESHWHHPFCRA
jgi:hypothetical protein